jgi:hypothetical protein
VDVVGVFLPMRVPYTRTDPPLDQPILLPRARKLKDDPTATATAIVSGLLLLCLAAYTFCKSLSPCEVYKIVRNPVRLNSKIVRTYS